MSGTKVVAITGLIATIALSGCGGGDSSTTTTTDQTSIHWSRCPGGRFQISTSGMSCVAARQFASTEAFGKPTIGPISPNPIPHNFITGAFHCTAFPEGVNAGWHVLCAYRDKHVSFFITP